MAQFSQQFLANLGRPQMAQSMFDLGSAVGGLPGKAKDSRNKQELNQLMQRIQGAQASGDTQSMKILAQELALKSPEKAAQVMQAATALEKQLGGQQALEGLFGGEGVTPEALMAAGKKALASGDTRTALALRDKAQVLSREEASRKAKSAAIQSELQGFMTNPKVSPEVKRLADQINRGFEGGGMDPEAVTQQMATLRSLALPKATGSRPGLREVTVDEEQPDGTIRTVVKFAQQDPVTGKITYETAGLAPTTDTDSGGSGAGSVAMFKAEEKLIEEERDLTSQALRAESLANSFDEYNPVGGLQGTFIEFAKEVSGQQDVISALRTEASRLSTSAAIDALPKGPASDKDIALVLKGVPPAMANAEYFAQYARGVAKMQRAEAQYKREQLNWLSRRGSYTGFTAHMTKKRVQEQFAVTDPAAIKMMEDNIGSATHRRSFIKNMGYDYVQYKTELEDASAILGGL